MSFILTTSVLGLVLALFHGAIALSEAGTVETPQQQLQALLPQKAAHASDPGFLLRLADLYLDVGDDREQKSSVRQAAYEAGAAFAKQAMDLNERNAQAHYLYAANLGSAAQLKGMLACAFTFNDLHPHLKRAVELNPQYPAALHMMGWMLDELPWVLGGDATAALDYLRRAVETDRAYLPARIDLAKAYLKRKEVLLARKELTFALQQPFGPDASPSKRRHRAEAQRLHDSLNAP